MYKYQIHPEYADKHLDVLGFFTEGNTLSGDTEGIQHMVESGFFIKPSKFVLNDDTGSISVSCEGQDGLLSYEKFAEKAAHRNRLALAASTATFLNHLYMKGLPYGWVNLDHIVSHLSDSEVRIIYVEPFIDDNRTLTEQDESARNLIVDILEGYYGKSRFGEKSLHNTELAEKINRLTSDRDRPLISQMSEIFNGVRAAYVLYIIIPPETVDLKDDKIYELYRLLSSARETLRDGKRNLKEAFVLPALSKSPRNGISRIHILDFDSYDVGFFPSVQYGDYKHREAALAFACHILRNFESDCRDVSAVIIQADDNNEDPALTSAQSALHRLCKGKGISISYTNLNKGLHENVLERDRL